MRRRNREHDQHRHPPRREDGATGAGYHPPRPALSHPGHPRDKRRQLRRTRPRAEGPGTPAPGGSPEGIAHRADRGGSLGGLPADPTPRANAQPRQRILGGGFPGLAPQDGGVHGPGRLRRQHRAQDRRPRRTGTLRVRQHGSRGHPRRRADRGGRDTHGQDGPGHTHAPPGRSPEDRRRPGGRSTSAARRSRS